MFQYNVHVVVVAVVVGAIVVAVEVAVDNKVGHLFETDMPALGAAFLLEVAVLEGALVQTAALQ